MTQTIYYYLEQMVGTPPIGFEWVYYLAGLVLVLFFMTYLLRIVSKVLTGGI